MSVAFVFILAEKNENFLYILVGYVKRGKVS